MADRDYASIGEVLVLLQAEFPDVTISKIRFLESQGLIDPERTPSGYRKFYADDVERLRFILREQKESFLPLKVIRERLVDPADEPADTREAPAHLAVADPDPTPTDDAPLRPPVWLADRQAARAEQAASRAAGHPSAGPAPEVATARDTPRPIAAVSDVLSGLGGQPGAEQAGPSSTVGAVLASTMGGVSLTLDELATASGLSVEQVAEVERYGLLSGRAVGRTTFYDEEALVVAKLAAAFFEFGVEPRHLRMYRTSAEREAGLFEQVVLPLVKQRNPQARAQAGQSLTRLATLGDELRRAMLRAQLRGLRE